MGSKSAEKRFQELMDRNNEGRLTPAEQRELHRFVKQDEEMMLANSETLLRASAPKLFDEAGRLAPSRLKNAIREKIKEPAGFR
jgi:hypothetical protein